MRTNNYTTQPRTKEGRYSHKVQLFYGDLHRPRVRRRVRRNTSVIDISRYIIGATAIGLYFMLCMWLARYSVDSSIISPIPENFMVVYANDKVYNPSPSHAPAPVVAATQKTAPEKSQEQVHEGDDVEALIRAAFSHDPDVAQAVARAESGHNCQALNKNTDGSMDVGLFQINSIHIARIARHGWGLQDMMDCEKNITIAKEIQMEQGWNPWVAYWAESYKPFLKGN